MCIGAWSWGHTTEHSISVRSLLHLLVSKPLFNCLKVAFFGFLLVCSLFCCLECLLPIFPWLFFLIFQSLFLLSVQTDRWLLPYKIIRVNWDFRGNLRGIQKAVTRAYQTIVTPDLPHKPWTANTETAWNHIDLSSHTCVHHGLTNR